VAGLYTLLRLLARGEADLDTPLNGILNGIFIVWIQWVTNFPFSIPFNL